MNHAESKTALVRKQIEAYLKERSGQWIRQIDIINDLLPNNPYDAQIGVFRGIFNKVGGIGGTIPIPHVELKKEGNKAFYRYVEPASIKFSKDSPLYVLAEEFSVFEKELDKEQLFNVDLRNLSSEEVKTYLGFIEKMEQIKKILFEGEN